MKARVWAFIIICCIAISAIFLWRNYGQSSSAPQANAAPPSPEVSVVTIEPRPITFSQDLPGRTSAFKIAEIRPQVSGIIIKRLFQEGSDVKEGQQLYQIDPAPYQASYDSAQASLLRAEANVKSVQDKAARYAQLVKIDAVSKQDYDDIVAVLAQNKAEVAVARASLDTAKINLDYTKVFSPISGRIGKSSVTEGALVTAGQPTALTTVQQLDPIYVDVTQSSSDLIKLRRQVSGNDSHLKQAPSAPVSLFLEGVNEPYDQKGELQFLDVTVDESTGAVQLRVLFPNPNQELLPGLFVRVRIDQISNTQAITVPQQAVSRNPDGSVTAWVVGEDNKVSLRPIKVTQAIENQWLVTDGLKTGEKVIVEGSQKIQPGSEVKTVPFDSRSATPTTGSDSSKAPH